MTSHPSLDELVAPLLNDDGAFAMLALDQRESLRRMFPTADGSEVGDEVLRAFKRTAMGILSPHASAILLDRLYAIEDRRPVEVADGCSIILAADVLDQPPGMPVTSTSLDPIVTPEFVRAVGAVAVKLLVIWSPDGRAAERALLVGEFVELARRAGVASLVEGIVQPVGSTVWDRAEDRDEAIVAAAAELSSFGSSIYKAQVPGYRSGDVSRVREVARRVTEVVDGPWVVLSNGVDVGDFDAAVRESVAGGASGFLAGRAIWADTIDDSESDEALKGRATSRLQTLASTVLKARAS